MAIRNAVDLKGYDKKIYLISFFITGFILVALSFVIENETTLKIFSAIAVLSFCRAINTVIDDIEASKKNFMILILVSALIAAAVWILILSFGWSNIWESIKWSVKKIPPYPSEFMLFFLVGTSALLAKTVLMSSLTNHYLISRNEIERIIGTIALGDNALGDNIIVRIEIPDIREFVSFCFSATIVIERGLEDGKKTELLRVENVLFALIKLWQINKAFNAKTYAIENSSETTSSAKKKNGSTFKMFIVVAIMVALAIFGFVKRDKLFNIVDSIKTKQVADPNTEVITPESSIEEQAAKSTK